MAELVAPENDAAELLSFSSTAQTPSVWDTATLIIAPPSDAATGGGGGGTRAFAFVA